VDGEPAHLHKGENHTKAVTLKTGDHRFVFAAPGYYPTELDVHVPAKDSPLEVKLERRLASLTPVTELHTGFQPKSVAFTPDGKFLLTALLGSTGVDLFSTAPFRKIKRISFPDEIRRKAGFVEMAFLEDAGELWVSQMTTGLIHVIDMNDFTYRESFPSGGVMPKVITVSRDQSRAFVSNWGSRTVGVIDVESREVVKTIPIDGIPRGMAVTGEDRYLYVGNYTTGGIEKIDLEILEVVKTLRFPRRGAMRHLVYDPERHLLYGSDILRGSILVLSTEDDRLLAEVPVDQKLNTIRLSPDGRFLFISSRGPNHPVTYLRKGFVFGKVYMMDTHSFDLRVWVWGGNQPTGLDVSPDGRFLVFSDFLDSRLEVYETNLRIRRLLTRKGI
jgi:YVTN family beta-propeller protein